MAIKSILKQVVIKDKNETALFLKALDEAEKKNKFYPQHNVDDVDKNTRYRKEE